ncbi:sugar ABC transporter substrate-binding protein [Streptomyces sp. NPDC048002]|uniref:ABC transporter substrate-binding protein n=1 Tax=Streptomyces sp. NPDC048002 TaxID=3154344 RepID=UPI0033D9274C
MKISIRRSRRAALAVALGSVLALTATACGDDGSGGGDKGAEGSGKGKIVFWDNNGGVRTDIWKEIIADFEKANPDIDVEYVGIASTEYQSKVDTAIQGGGLPDVGGVGAAMLAGFSAQNALEPLDERLAGSSLNGKLNADMVASLKAAGGGEDALYSIPTSANNGVLYYRTDLFDKAGLEEPSTWDAFYTAAEKLTAAKKNEFGYTIRGGAGSIAQALDAMYGQSGITEFWDGDKTTVNDPKNVAALEKYAALFKRVTPAADLNNDFTKMVAQWDSGTIGMLNHNLGSYQDHVKAFGADKFRGIPQPVGDSGKRVQVSNPVDGLGVFQSSKNKDAAWKFIEYAVSHEANSKFNESAGQVPANNDAAKDAWVSAAEPTKLAAEALTDGSTTIVQLPYYLPDWNTISKAENEPNFQKVLLGDLEAKDFLDTLAEQLNEAQAEWNEQNA